MNASKIPKIIIAPFMYLFKWLLHPSLNSLRLFCWVKQEEIVQENEKKMSQEETFNFFFLLLTLPFAQQKQNDDDDGSKVVSFVLRHSTL